MVQFWHMIRQIRSGYVFSDWLILKLTLNYARICNNHELGDMWLDENKNAVVS